MLFKTFTSFNNFDTKREKDPTGRTRVAHGVEQRCDKIVKLFARFSKAKAPRDILTLLRATERDAGGKETYSAGDVEYALGRLVEVGVLSHPKRMQYCLAKNGKQTWKDLEKTKL